VVATEQHLSAEVTLPDGQQVRLNGYADRLELDENGRVVVIDLKTSKYPPTDKELPANAQLGLYQYAVDHGAVDELTAGHTGAPAQAGGAELVQLGLTDGGDAAVVQPQAPQEDDGPQRDALRAGLGRTAALLRAETFPAVAGQHCRDCSFVPICPIKGAGSVTAQ
jgi:RecB family exonuclease